MHKRLSLIVIGIKSVEHRPGGDRQRHRQITAGKAFRQTHDVGSDSGMIAGKHLSRPAESGRNLVGNQQNVKTVAQRAQFLQIQRRINPHTGAALQQRFDNHGARLFRIPFKTPLRLRETGAAALFPRQPERTAVTVGSRNAHNIHQHRFVDFCIQIEGTDTQRADGFSMIAVAETHETSFSRSARLMHILKCHFQSAFDRSRTVVGEVELYQSAGNDLR